MLWFEVILKIFGRADLSAVFRGVVPGCAGCAMAHPDFGRSVNLISTRGDRLWPPNYYWQTRIFRPSDGPEVCPWYFFATLRYTFTWTTLTSQDGRWRWILNQLLTPNFPHYSYPLPTDWKFSAIYHLEATSQILVPSNFQLLSFCLNQMLNTNIGIFEITVLNSTLFWRNIRKAETWTYSLTQLRIRKT